jgi:hypothetical protein
MACFGVVVALEASMLRAASHHQLITDHNKGLSSRTELGAGDFVTFARSA